MQQRDQSPPAFGFGKQSRTHQIRKDRDLQGVGPFSYSMSFVDKKREASFSMGAKLGSSLVNKGIVSPAPDNYNPGFTNSKFKAPEYKIGTAQRAPSYDQRKAKLVPGAGTYEIKSAAFNAEKPKFHMGSKLTFDDTTKYIHSLPGPGTHEPTPSVIKTKSPIFSMGQRLMSQKDTTAIVPGPGSYVNSSEKLKQSAPSFGFGTSKRPVVGFTKLQVPGPGSYKLPVKVADVAPFALPNRKDESKYV